MKKLILVILIAFGLLAACGSGGNAQDQDTQDATPSAPSPATPEPVATPQPDDTENDIDADPGAIDWDEHITFTWFMVTSPGIYSDDDTNPGVEYLQERFNVSFEFNHPPIGMEGAYFDNMMAGGVFTDVIYLSSYQGDIAQLYYDGVIVDIAGWLDYMPNKRRLLETNRDFARAAFDDNGRILQLVIIQDEPGYASAGLMYRHDILETMTEGYVQFPSGSDIPMTIEDWEYMLPLFLEYFLMQGFEDYAPFILPASGVNPFGAMTNSFGGYHGLYRRDGVVYHGLLQPGFFDYVATMRDWYMQGFLHQGFADDDRLWDMFFMPNPGLVFGGAAGAFYGMMMHVGDRLSAPELELHFDVRAVPSPRAVGINRQDMLRRQEDVFSLGRHSAVAASNPDIGRFLAVIDVLYSETDTAGWHRGTGGAIRLPGFFAQSVVNNARDAETARAHQVWTAQCSVSEVLTLPRELTPTLEEAARIAEIEFDIDTILDEMLVGFIRGDIPLDEGTWADFTGQVRDVGAEELVSIMQAVYGRFLARGL